MLFMKEDACLVPVLRYAKPETFSIVVEVLKSAWFTQLLPILGVYSRGLTTNLCHPLVGIPAMSAFSVTRDEGGAPPGACRV